MSSLGRFGKFLRVQARSLLRTPVGFRMDRLRQYPVHDNPQEFIRSSLKPEAFGLAESLDIGCGPQPQNPFAASGLLGADIRSFPENNVVSCDLVMQGLPFEDARFDYVTAFHFIEHVPRHIIDQGRTRFPFIELMNHVHRVLKPGGLFYAETPAYPFKEAFQDPTHINLITEDTFPRYFCAPDNWAAMYGFLGHFELVAQGWRRSALLTLLRKV